MRSFEEKRKLLDKIDKLRVRRIWSTFEESRRACAGHKDRYTRVKVRECVGSSHPVLRSRSVFIPDPGSFFAGSDSGSSSNKKLAVKASSQPFLTNF